MKSNQTDRLAVVSSLLDMTRSLEHVGKELAKLEWDYDGSGVELTRLQLSAVLRRYLEGSLTVNDVENWANLVESREDVYFEISYEQKIEDVLYELANPILTQPLNQDRANVLLEVLTC